jgi:uncharacterized membrane protein SirB2
MTGASQQEPGHDRPSSRAAPWLAWSLAGLSVALFLASIPLFVLARSAHVPSGWGADLSVGGLLGGAAFLIFPLLGALIAARHPRNPMGWILLAEGLLWTLGDTLNYYALCGVARPGSVPFPLGVAGINNWVWVPTVGLMGTFIFMLFPDGRLPSRRWRPLAWLSGVTIFLVSALVGLTPEPLQNLGGRRNPFGILAFPWLKSAPYVLVPLFLLCMLLSVLSLVLRYRRSRGEERQQIKWIAFAAAVVGLLYLIAMIGSFVYPQETWFAPGSPLWQSFLEYTALLSFILVPIAVGVAMLRYRLYDIDLIINRALVYGSLTVVLAATYEVAIVALQEAFRALTGQGSTLAIVASTLAIAGLFHPARRRIQGWIDRRFYRRKYDAAKTLEAFSAKLREETDLGTLGEHLIGVVGETMEPTHVSLWLRPESAPGDSRVP